MPEIELDILVKLASIGTSGICIFGIFLTGFLISRSAQNSNPPYHQSLSKYMTMVMVIAVISALSGVSNAYIKQIQIVELEVDLASVSDSKNRIEAVAAANALKAERYQAIASTNELMLSELTRSVIAQNNKLEARGLVEYSVNLGKISPEIITAPASYRTFEISNP